MKKFVSIVAALVLSASVMAGIHSYTEHSVLESGKWVKIRVSETGVCRMSFSELEAAGLNPQQLRVFGYGGAQKTQDFSKPNIDDLPQVPVYVGSDYVLFYVQGPISWSYDGSRFRHVRNTYSNYGYYLLSDNVGEMLAPTEGEPVEDEMPTDVTTYVMYQVHDKDSINLIDRGGVHGGGRTFYGEQFGANTSRTFTFPTPNALTDENSTVYADMAGYANVATYFYASLNSSEEKSVYIRAFPDNYTKGCVGNLTNMRYTSQADKQSLKLRYEASLASAFGWLNSIEIFTPCELKMAGSYMPIRTQTNYKLPVAVRYHLAGAGANTQIWDVTNLDAIQRMPVTLSGDTAIWMGLQLNGIREYVAVNTQGDKWVKAETVGNVPNQNLHALKNIDYVIISPEEFVAEATRLAKAHEEKQGITWAVVTDQQVYNEFSSGTPDATAYRWIMKMLYDRADGNAIQKPRWLLLMGHGTFDNRKFFTGSGTAMLLTYQAKNSENEVNAYCTEDYFGFLDDNEGESDTQGRLDIGVGRLPVNNITEAQTTVDKLIAYIQNDDPGKWKSQILYVADDGEHGTHTETAEVSAERVRVKNPDFVVNKVYLDAYPQETNASGESYPLAKNRIDNLLKSGVLFFDYSGHGSYNGVTNEGILNLKDIQKMNNRNQAFWLFATCSFSECDGGRLSSGEAAILNPNGGAIGVLAATRTVYATPNTELNRSVTDTLFGHRDPFHYDMTIGEACAIGKNMLGSDANKMAYVLLGDPAIRLNYPTEYQVATTTKMDTLNALSVQHVEGFIIDEDSATVDFNGTVDITVYDKMQVITTRDNDSDPSEAKELRYNDYPSTIFTGSAQVKDGTFNYTFMVPKDIRYNFGKGRIVYYAYTTDSLELAEAVGHFEEFVVGGTGNSFYTDTVGPEMTIYLNSPSFQDGGTTNSTPRFYAILSDDHGINTAGAGIGHDLLLIVDNDPTKIYTLNEYFVASNNSYQKGQVSYLMDKLEDGQHSLTFRAWDLLNNSTTKALNFIVNANADPNICAVMSYPNPAPASQTVNIIIDYDRPDDLVETELFLYDLSGQLIYRHTQNDSDRLLINLTSLGVQPGVYVYNIRIKSASNRYSRASGKIIVTK